MNFLVTGGAGFIGSNFVKTILDNNNSVVNLDSLSYAGSKKTIENLSKNNKNIFFKCNIGDKNKTAKILKKYKPQIIVNFAAETHVDRSINNPDEFIETNILDTYKFINTVKEYWEKLNNNKKRIFKFIHVSTDEVYGDKKKGSSQETDQIISSSPYSASKAAAEQIFLSYFRTYNFPVIITRSSNNYGPYQFPEKLIPLTLINALEGKNINIYGNGEQVRNWIYVDDNNKALIQIIKKGKLGEIYNIGGYSEISNISLVKKICKILDKKFPLKNKKKYHNLIKFVQDRPGHDKRYSLNIKKIQKEIGWKLDTNINLGLEKTISWYLDNFNWWKKIRKTKYSGKRIGIYDK